MTFDMRDWVFIYFVRVGDFVKIGMSREWKKRIANLKVAVPFDVELLHVELGLERSEKSLHKRFRKLHHRREWFHAHPILLAYIAGRAAEPGRSMIKRDTREMTEVMKQAKRGTP